MTTIRLILPNEAAEKINGFLKKQIQKLKLNESSLAGQGDRGAIFDGAKLFTREEFLSAHNHFGAVLVCPDKKAVCMALGLELGTAGMIEGLTVAEYAKAVKKSRQFITEQLKKKKLKGLQVGSLWVVTEKLGGAA